MNPRQALRAMLPALSGLALGVGGGVIIAGILVFWYAAVWSLLDGAGDWSHILLYLAYVVLGPVLLLGFGWVLTTAQRARFAAVRGVRIAQPRMIRVWRQLGYHLLAPVIWPVGRLDVALGRALLGPSRTEELTERVESLARSRADIIAATDAERRRIERDLHDGAQQRLLSLAMNLGMARATFTDDTSGPARQAIESAHDEATQAIAELREFVRGLHPAVLNDRGLDAALSGIAARAPLPVRLHVDAATRCSPTIEAIAYFVVSEALTNVAKHAGASRVEVTVRQVGGRLRIVVTDDGRGGARPDSGTGLRGLAQRTTAVDGTLTIDSPAGGPTTITAELPCES